MSARSYLALAAALAAASAVAACSPFGATAFLCQNDPDCGAGGKCIESTGLCSFPSSTCEGGYAYGEYAGDLANQCVMGGTLVIVDAPFDAPPPATCVASTSICFGSAIETCKANGQGFDPTLRQECPLVCDGSGAAPVCLAASSIPVDAQRACGTGTDVTADLQGGVGAVISIRDTGITCTGCTIASIAPRGTTPNTWFCLRTLILGAGVEINTENVGPVTLFVAGTTTIDATLDFVGRGPGAFRGGDAPSDNNPGRDGTGPCPGLAGGRQGTTTDFVGGGGGGAGAAGVGGKGGDGDGAAAGIALGGNGGLATCDSPLGVPLRGGSGGASGGDGSCGLTIACGGRGGTGGGAIHLASRATITGAGSINVSGGDGQSTGIFKEGGGGGGGAGGTILLEAPAVTLGGSLVTRGGDGGDSALRNGGDGGDGNTLGGSAGRNGGSDANGGSGGGAAAGRIRINTLMPATCNTAEPRTACSTGTLIVAP